MRTISYPEYKRRVFNKCLMECLVKLHESCCCDDKTPGHMKEMANRFAETFYNNELKLGECSISTTKKNLMEAVTFIKDCVNISEGIACDKCDDAKAADLEIPEDQEIELSDYEEALIDKVFEDKDPSVQVDQVRDATVQALIEEDKKAQEIKDSINIAQSQVAAGEDPKVMEETVNRLSGRGPTSLMNAILNSVSAAAVRDVNENAKTPVAVGKVMSENADEIKDRAVMMYTLFECANVFGVVHYTKKDIKALAEKIYYNK